MKKIDVFVAFGVEVILRRYETVTGQAAVLESTGERYVKLLTPARALASALYNGVRCNSKKPRQIPFAKMPTLDHFLGQNGFHVGLSVNFR
jgi:hypothetical protein